MLRDMRFSPYTVGPWIFRGGKGFRDNGACRGKRGWSLLFVQSRVHGVGKRYGEEAEEDTGLGTRATALTAFDLLP